jgi:hypothetical protein
MLKFIVVLDWGVREVLLDDSKNQCKKSPDVWSLTLKIKEERKFRCSEGSLLFLEDECITILRKDAKALPSDTASQKTWIFSSIKHTAYFITRLEAWLGFCLTRKTCNYGYHHYANTFWFWLAGQYEIGSLWGLICTQLNRIYAVCYAMRGFVAFVQEPATELLSTIRESIPPMFLLIEHKYFSAN